MTRILPSALSWEKSWRTPASTATTITTISTERSNVLITLNLFCGQDYEQRAMSYQEKMGTDICFDWIDDMTTVLYHQPSAIPVSHLYTNSSVVVSTYFIIAGRRLPLVSNLLSTTALRSSILQRILVLSFYVSSYPTNTASHCGNSNPSTQTLYPLLISWPCRHSAMSNIHGHT